MKNILTINAYGIVTNRSNHAVITNNVPFIGYNTTINTASSGQIIVTTGNGNLQFVTPGVLQYSMGGPNTAAKPIYLRGPQPKPKYISTLGGTFFKDQKDNIIKYQSVIKGSFTNKSE